MDEPTGNLDQANSENLLHMIGEVQKQTGTTFLVATHDGSVAGAAARPNQAKGIMVGRAKCSGSSCLGRLPNFPFLRACTVVCSE
jgi:ABC-type lipoprotein export system ATPase subunit